MLELTFRVIDRLFFCDWQSHYRKVAFARVSFNSLDTLRLQECRHVSLCCELHNSSYRQNPCRIRWRKENDWVPWWRHVNMNTWFTETCHNILLLCEVSSLFLALRGIQSGTRCLAPCIWQTVPIAGRCCACDLLGFVEHVTLRAKSVVGCSESIFLHAMLILLSYVVCLLTHCAHTWSARVTLFE